MPNENHEVYSGENICTYTDYITALNSFTNEEIDACILSAGTPNGFENRGEIANGQNTEQVAANSISPWYSRSGMYLEYDTEECNQMDPASWQSYYHILYGYWADGNVALCTDMDIKKYRNQVTITPRSNTYHGHTFNYYEMSIQTQYGDTGDWHNSVLKPIIIIPTETIRMGAYIGLNSYKHWATTEMYVFFNRYTTTSYNTYISFNDGTGGLAPTTCPCSIGDDFVWTPTSETDSNWLSDDHYDYGWFDINSGGFHAYSFQEYNNIDDLLMIVAICGLKFEYNGTTYKPIVTGGIVTGYTDDMTEESEWDEWENIGDHTIPVDPTPVPPPPPSGEDDIDSMGFDGMSCNVGGPAKYYIMSYSDIHHLIGDFNAHAEPGTSISNNIISCYVNALDWNWSTGSEPIEIYSGGAQTTAFTSDINYDVLTGYNARDIIGSIDVPRMTNTFYDFSPYSTYEVYVPFCGWVALPDTVAGRHIKIYFETDEATCGCKGRVFFVDDSGNGVTVAEITGSFGAPCPIQVIEGGLYKQAMLSNGLQVIGGIASGVMGGASGSGVLAVGGLSNAMQGLGNCLVAGNTNYGQTIGRAGDASGLMCAGKPYLKITYPPVDEVVNNNMFAHTVGYLCNTIGQLSNFHGFTVCANPHIHISATSTEKEEIKRLLEQGVILP